MGAIEFKYVMVDTAFPVIFFANMQHKAFSGIGKITSAGLVRIIGRERSFEVETYGESAGLKMRPEDEDAGIIKLFLEKAQGAEVRR
jgi:hypothetical protein